MAGRSCSVMMLIPVFLSILSFVFAKTELKEEDDVAILTNENFDTVVAEYDFVLVKFYASWCGHCKALKPEYSKAAKELKSIMPNVLIAKVDAIAERELASRFDVKGYPTLKFRKNGNWIDCTTDRNSDAIIKWIQKKTGPSVRVLNTIQEVEEFTKAANVVVGFIKSGQTEPESILGQVAESIDSFAFGITKSPDAFKKFGVEGDVEIVLFKTFDEPRTSFKGELTVPNLTKFVQIESFPLVVEFDEDSANFVFGSEIRIHLVAFVGKSSVYTKILEQMRETSKRFKGQMHFVIIDTDIEDHQRIMEFFGLTKEDLPTYRIVNLSEDMIKYKPDAPDFSLEPMSTFIQEVLDGKRKPFLMSQEVPPESDDPVRVLVGKNYHEVTKDESKAVFVKLYAPWCSHCQQLAPIWSSLGEAFKTRDDIIIAKCDATANEPEGVHVRSFPTLKFYPKGSQEAIDYKGERTLEAMKEFVESGGTSQGKSADETEEREDEKDEL